MCKFIITLSILSSNPELGYLIFTTFDLLINITSLSQPHLSHLLPFFIIWFRSWNNNWIDPFFFDVANRFKKIKPHHIYVIILRD
ncbi:hypothetical protein DERF_003290 [Dermatophagoides farinae]|uniref:Uncharacterized protein n=1 Tax=Dermatophagoides farinae TaxID=6954 RepID=A0A922LBE1_DERFA|nr:hypothetical protein DERF_003290 [Dermatophagoides farinae]